jgi:transposase-like protein
MEVVFKRKFIEEERAKIVNEVLETGSSILIAKRYQLNVDLLSRWLNNYRRYGVTIMPKEAKIKEVIPNYKKEYEKMKKEITDKDLEIQVLRELLEKKRIAHKKELK